MNKKIIEYNEFIGNLWDDLSNDLINEDEYFKKYDKWMIENGSEELFDYLISQTDNKWKIKEFENLKDKWKKINNAF